MVTWTCKVDPAHRFTGDQAASDRYRQHYETGAVDDSGRTVGPHTPKVITFNVQPVGDVGVIDILARGVEFYDLNNNFIGSQPGLAARFGVPVSQINTRGLYVTDVGGAFVCTIPSYGSMFFAFYALSIAGNFVDERLTVDPHLAAIYHGIQGQTVPFNLGGGSRNGVAQSMAVLAGVVELLLTRYGATINKIVTHSIKVRGFV